MKKLIGFALLLASTICSAQNVNIPDPNFKQALLNHSPVIDTNGDGEIQVNEALAVTQLQLDSATGAANIISITGIQAFQNLTLIWISQNHIPILNFSGLAQLRLIGISHNHAASIVNFSGCVNLEHVQLLYLSTPGNPVSLELGTIRGIKEFYNTYSYFSSIDLSSQDSLSVLMTGGFTERINVSGLTKLEVIGDFTCIGELIARDCPALWYLSGGSMGANHSIDVAGCVNLKVISYIGPNLTRIDLSTCPNFTRLTSGYIYSLEYLNVKNGSFATLDLSGTAAAPVLKICADDFEIDSLRQLLTGYMPSVIVSSTCSFLPAGNYNVIQGKVRLNANGNGCTEADPGLNMVPIRINDGSSMTTRFTSGQGDFRHYPNAGVFTLTPYFPYPYYDIAPALTTIDFDTTNSLIDSAKFCILPNGLHHDLDVTIIPLGPARPGMGVMYQLVYKNRGTTSQSGNVQFNYQNSKMSFASSSLSPASQTAGQITWNYSALLPFERRVIDLDFSILPLPVNNISDTIYYMATINPVSGDETPFDNSFVLAQRITGSYDPNDKTCLQGNALSPASIGKPLDYLIRFQNLGTDTAFNVVVVDTLSDKFDWNSLEIVSTSHACDIELKDNKLQFYFQDIKLPYAAINEPASHGFVAFKIKPKPNVIIGDSLNNTASIYFDFNLPVVTNTASTIVAEPAGPVPVKLEYFSLRSKTSGNELTWKIATEDVNTNFSLERSDDGIHFNSIKNLSANRDRCQVPFNFTDEKPLAGTNFYRLKITDADNKSFYSKTLQTGKTTSGVELIAVTNDPVNTYLFLSSSKARPVQIKLLAADGKLLLFENKTLAAGANKLMFGSSGFAKGVYSIVLYTGEEILTKRFVH